MSENGPQPASGSSPGPPPDPGARDALARAQAELLAALVAGGETPAGFDGERLRIQASSLIAKRRGQVARLRPDLVRALGGDFAAEFAAYARGRPKPPGGSRADARDFAEALRAAGRIAGDPALDPAPEPVPVPEPVPRPRWWVRLRGR
ncbi:hypothetical protein GCM10010156_26350 [Planobispora rosea]|uniref:SCO6045-like C-terminal domain-containing protein n=1 Tax=Planobispora rosea TaxID=35762 RepID=A0A8J3S2X8_PLARO|nr:hypothetical protein [Planobispora rosea]GGS66095.1 hypothetical protein GCM10010156_26350 [Planobispora rosea]GIH84996.1 hypothetical protein Pro02_34040 [Planobispora rosea]